MGPFFANNTSLFSIVQDINESAKYLNLDLSVSSQWAYQWKIFSSKKLEENHPSAFYNNIEVSRTDSQKHLGLVLDNKFTFKKHIKDELNKAYFGVGNIKKT